MKNDLSPSHILDSSPRRIHQLAVNFLTLPSECVSLSGPGFEDIQFILVIVVAVGMWESASSISKVCGKGGKQHHRFPSFP